MAIGEGDAHLRRPSATRAGFDAVVVGNGEPNGVVLTGVVDDIEALDASAHGVSAERA